MRPALNVPAVAARQMKIQTPQPQNDGSIIFKKVSSY